jgi:hypothetical protein
VDASIYYTYIGLARKERFAEITIDNGEISIKAMD